MSMPDEYAEVHALLKGASEMFSDEADRIEDPVLRQAVGWAAAAMGMAHMAYDFRVRDLISENN